MRNENLTAAFSYTCPENVAEAERWVDVPFTYYPNYCAFTADGQALRTEVGEQGVLRVYLPEEASGRIEVTYREPGYYLAGRVAAALCLLSIVLWKLRILPLNKFRR